MRYRTYPRTGWQVSEIGYGMWGMGGWTGSDDEESLEALDLSIGLGCNFFDTAWAYGNGHSEQLLGQALRRHAGTRLYVATKVPPKNRVWPGKAETPIADVFPPDHIREYTEKSLRNLGVDDARPAAAPRLERCVGGRRGLEARGGGSEAREADHQLRDQREPVGAGERPAGARDRASWTACRSSTTSSTRIPRTCCSPIARQHGIAIIARVPFDEGSLTGTLRADSDVARGRLAQPLLHARHAARRRSSAWIGCMPLVPPGRTLPELALRFILHHPAVTTTIPGMRQPAHVRANLAASDATPLPAELLASAARAPLGEGLARALGEG